MTHSRSKIRWLSTAFSVLLLLICLVPLAAGQPGVQGSNPPKTVRSLVGVQPSLAWDAKWLIPSPFDRVLYVHPADRTDGTNARTWVHRPLLAFVETETPHEGYPAIVQRVDEDENGAHLEFKMALSDPLILEQCKRVLLNPDMSKQPPSLNAEEIFIVPWSIEHAVIDCRVALGGKLLATTETSSLLTHGNTLEFALDLSAEDLALFKRLAPQGRIEFIVRYTFGNRIVASAEDHLRASRSIELAVETLFTDEQKNGSAPIFQDDYNRVERWVRIDAVRHVRTQHPDLMPVLSNETFLNALLAPESVTFEKLEGDQNMKRAVAEHLKPLIDTLTTETATTDETVTTDSKKKTDTIELDLSATFSAVDKVPLTGSDSTKSLSGSGKYTMSKEKLHQVVNTAGLTVKETDVKNRYAPQSIRVYRKQKGGDTSQVNNRTYAYLALGSVADYVQESPVPSNFTLSGVLKLVSDQPTRAYFDSIPLGTMLPYFGADEAPRGYVFADGKTNWPDEKWVPESLRNKPVPNMNGRSPFGGDDESKVGAALDGGVQTLTIPPFSVPQTEQGESAGKYSWIKLPSPLYFQNQREFATQDGNGRPISSFGYSGPVGVQITSFLGKATITNFLAKKNYEQNVTPWGSSLGMDYGKLVYPAYAEAREGSLPGPWQIPEGKRSIALKPLKVDGSSVLPPRVVVRWIIKVK